MHYFRFFVMIRRPPRSTLSSSSAASDVYKRQYQRRVRGNNAHGRRFNTSLAMTAEDAFADGADHPPLTARLDHLSDDPLTAREAQEAENCTRLTEEDILLRSHDGVEADNLCTASKLAEALLSGLRVSHISGLEGFRNLRVLDLSCNRIDKIQGVDQLQNLRELRLAANRLSSTAGIGKLHKLEVLHLQHNALRGLEDFDALRKLQVLSCSNNNITSVKGLMKCTALRMLDLSENKVQDLELLSHMSQLQSLEAANNGIQTLPKTALAGFGELEELDLDSNGLNVLPSIKALKKLGVLRVSHNKLESLACLHGLPRLTELYAASNSIQQCCDLTKLTKLEVLDLGHNAMGAGLAWEQLGALKDLRELSLQGNPVADSPQYQQDVAVCKALERLDGVDIDERPCTPMGAIPIVQGGRAVMSAKAIERQNDGMFAMLQQFRTQVSDVFCEIRSEISHKYPEQPSPPPAAVLVSPPKQQPQQQASRPGTGSSSTHKPSTPSKGGTRLVLDASLFARPATANSRPTTANSRPTTAQSTAPVSYTHLRAHETVLDLVCRLLLEKKKKYNKRPRHDKDT
eukprot:TRINITY_DN3804_c0_g1_i4.p1 TRINITY_DN3804_c0_g1~~TRINITY_DN3804_c0_g1_i4.p1  ORF type:complete len:574 (-),score=184.92 TRINITY_DN3804_c0_g1_i4:28-1749(-)